MAEQLDVGLRYFQRIEEDGENLTIETIAKIANVLGVDPAVLFTPPVSTKRPGRGRPSSKPR
jgi:transcriptional regulator with XRE-family HTH domain